MFKILTRRSFWINLLVAIALILVIIFLALQSLEYFTHHGSYLKVPDVSKKNVKDATALLNKEGFEVWIQDSVYFDTLPPLTVVKQFPEPDASVKVNRVVYLTVNRSVAPEIEMPNLVGMSFRNAELELKARGLRLGDTVYKPDIAKNAVLDQLLNNKSIRPGTKITMGTTLSLVLGAGIGSTEMPVPDLFGMNYEEAITLLEASGITIGSVVPDLTIKDTASAFVFRQQPQRYNENGNLNNIRKGQMIDIWITRNKPEKIVDSATVTPTNRDSNLNEY